MKIPSVTFGEVEVNEDEIYIFDEGIPGLKGINKYFLIDRPDLAPFKWLQACQPGYLSLMTLDPIYIEPKYHINLSREYAEALGVKDLETEVKDLIVQSLIVVPDNPKDMTANLLAPIVLNPNARKGMQIVVEGNRDMLRVKVIKDS